MTDETGFAALTQVDGPLPAPEPVLEGSDIPAAAILDVPSGPEMEAMAMKMQLHTAMNRLSLRECREVIEWLEVQGVSVKF